MKTEMAFPGFEHYVAGEKVITGQPHGGITMRDYFAAAALTAIIYGHGSEVDESKRLAREAYQVADSMLEERKKGDHAA